MRNSENYGFNGGRANRFRLAGLILSVLVGLTAAAAWAQPANDNFANATVITGTTGTTNGSNVGATSEPGEPVHAGTGGGKSIWYVWTATFTGTISFNTEGSSFDTVLAAYTGNSVNNLTQVAANDDVDFPVDLTSAISFPVTAGTTYHIAVDGFLGDTGSVELSWTLSGTLSAGNFLFAAPIEPTTPTAGVPFHPSATPFYPRSDFDEAGTAGAQVRVTRVTGSSGKVEIGYIVTNLFFTTITMSNIYGTNFFVTNYDTNMVLQNFTNTFSTNFFTIQTIQSPSSDDTAITTCNLTNGFETTGGLQITVISNNNGATQTTRGNVVSNAFALCGNMSGTVTVTNGNTITVTASNVFCTNIVVTNKSVPSAVPGTDYQPSSGTLTFEDYEMGRWIPINILGNTQALQNRLVVVLLTNAVLDPNEGGIVAPPTIDPVGGRADFILQSVNIPPGQTTSEAPCLTNMTGGVNVLNIEGTVFFLPYGYDEGTIPVLTDVSISRANPNSASTVQLWVAPVTNPLSYNNTFALQPGSDYANPMPPDGSIPSSQPPNYQAKLISTINFGNGVDEVTIEGTVLEPITNTAVTFNEDLELLLNNAQNATLGQSATATITIGFHNQPPGAVDRDHNMDNQRETVPPYNTAPGANNLVYAVAIQPDNKTVFTGDFTAYNTVPRNRVARMNADGSLDTTFAAAPNSGADGVVTCVALQGDGSIIIGGNFTSYNGTSRFGIARLDSGGNLDTSFNPGVGVNGNVTAVAIQPADGKVLVAGNFTAVNSTNRNSIARLNPDGSLDTTFDPGIGPNNTIESIALQLDGKVVIGGDFTSLDNTNLNYVARLNTDGSLDTAFNPAAGPDNSVLSVAIQNDQRIVLGGAFHFVNQINRSGVARLNTDGSLDNGFNPGSGFDANVDVVAMQPDGKILAGGLFKSFNGTRRVGVARLLPYGSLDTAFMDTAFNQFAGLVKDYFNDNYQPRNFLDAIAVQGDGNIIIAGSFDHLGGETNKDNEDFARDGIGQRENIARLIGNFPVQPTLGVSVPPAPGNIGLAYSSYTADKTGGPSYITMYRTNGGLGPASVTFTPIPGAGGPGVAVPNTDFTVTQYNPVWPTIWSTEWEFADSAIGPNFEVTDTLSPVQTVGTGFASVFVNVINDTNSTGDLSLSVGISQPQSTDIFFLGGENIPIGVALDNNVTAPMTIVEPTLNHGVLGFSSNAFSVSEAGTNALITVTRTGGSTGTVTIKYATVAGGTAAANQYTAVSGTLTFSDSVTSQTFLDPIANQNQVAPDKTVNLQLSNPTGGGTGGLTNSVLTIINDNYLPGHVNFSSTNFTAQEDSGSATITVTRTGGSQNTLSVTYVSSDGTATNGQNYGTVSNTVNWNSGDITPKTFSVPLIDDSLVTSNLTVDLRLTNAQVNGTVSPLALGLTTNATLTIINDDFYGRPTFSTPTYTVNGNAGSVTITVNRLGGSSQTISVNYNTADGTAFGNINYTPVSGTLTFNPGVFSQAFTVPIIPQNVPTGNTAFQVILSDPQPASGPGGAVALGNPSNSTVTIVDNLTFNEPPGGLDTTLDPAAGFNDTVYSLALQGNGQILAGGDFTFADGTPRNRIARLNTDGSIDPKFSSPSAGLDASLRALLIQSDGPDLIGGLFTQVNGVNRQYIGRLNFDGGLDETFNPGSGADNPVYALGETFDGSTNVPSNRRLVIGGSFVSINGVTRNNFAQLNNDGSVDTNFSPLGANGTVWALEVYSTNDSVNGGKIIIGGDFTEVNGVARNHVARLNADGSLDATFNPGAGPNDSLRAVAIQVDGKVVIGGLFSSVGSSGLNHIARLNPNGLVDALFNPGVGANDIVNCITIQEDHRILLGGDFTQANGVTRNRLTRLNEDGTVDPGINFGSGADSFVSSVVVQPDDEIVIAGGFTEFEGVSRPHFARLYGRNYTGGGSLQFVAADFPVVENVSTNVVISVQRTGGTAGQATALFETSDETALSGSNYIGVTNTLVFPNGETFQSISVPILPNQIVDINRIVNLLLTNFTGATAGGQPIATITIINDNSGVNFSSPTYTIIKNAVNGAAIITVDRVGSSIGPASVDFTTTTNGTALPGTDYTPTAETVLFADGQSSQTLTVPVINNGLLEGNRTVGMALSNPTNSLLLSPNAATLTIVDNNLPPGNFSFSSVAYSVPETAGSALITVIRTNGSVGEVQVNFSVSGGTAAANVNYIPTNGTLTFGDGVTSESFAVPVINDPVFEGNVTVNVNLSNPTGGTQIIGLNPVPLTIQEENTGLSFDHASYFTEDSNGIVTVGVQRMGGTNSAVTVSYSTTNGTAQAGRDYTTTSGSLSFAVGEVFKTFNVPILRNPAITGNLIFLVNLSNPSANAQLVSPFSSAISIFDSDTGLSFASASNSVAKSAGVVAIPVVRTGSTVGTVSVNFSTEDGTATASTNYVPTNGVLTFADGQTSNSFNVTLIDDNLVDPNLTFTNLLFSPSGNAQLLSPSNETVTLINDEAGFSFSSPVYTVTESGVAATITVVRTGNTNSAVSVNYATSDGTAHAPGKYTPASGTLSFASGQISASFTVTIIDTGTIDGDETVNLTLSSPSTSATLLNPNSATLTILGNGSLIVPAGAALTSESGPVDGAIEPGETVTLLFALRNAAGTNTANLTATLLATNGITVPTPATPVSYGVLVTNGPSVSRSFGFTASGTNGSLISATFQLQDGPTNLGTAVFNFTLGRTTNVFTSTGAIVIPDHGTATPYPAQINVSGVVGTVSKVTATLSNLTHANISDVSALLMGPTGTNTLLMSKIGGNDSIANVTLTFDDTATSQLTANPPVSGTYKPTQFSLVVPFPASSNGPGLLPKPFGTLLAGFVNSNPNGAWNLFVFDDTPLDSGIINNGWSLDITTLGVIPPAVDLVAGVTATPASSIVLSNVTYTISVTNAGPSTATGVTLSDVLPVFDASVVTVVSSNASQGSWSGSGGTLVCNFGTLAMGASATATLVVTSPASPTQLTNVVSVTANQADENPANNTASVVTVVNPPSADLALGISDSPDPVNVGASLTYTITVTNLGPATATSVMVTNTLPHGVSFVSASPLGVATNVGGTVIGSLGAIGSGQTETFSIVAEPTVAGTVTNTAVVGSTVPDPLKGNNKATVKTVVQGGTQVNLVRSGANWVFTWPSSAGMGLQYATNLTPPVVWTSLTNPSPNIISGQDSVTIPVSSGTMYYRLISPWP